MSRPLPIASAAPAVPAGTRFPRGGSLAALVLLAALATPPCRVLAQDPVPAATPEDAAATAEEPAKTVEEQLEELRQKVLVLERKGELDAEAAAEKAKTGAGATAGAKDGFSFKSNDGAFTLKVRGYLQLDGRAYDDPDQPNPGGARTTDGFVLRRVRPIFEGTLYKKFGFRIMPDFGAGTTVLQDAYLDWQLADWATLRFGKYKAPLGLERLQSATDLSFVERGAPTNLGPLRDLGIQLGGAFAGGKVEYAVGVFNGSFDGGSADTDVGDDKDVIGRVFVSPWKGTPSALSGLGFGIASSSGNQRGTVTSTGLGIYRSSGVQTFFSYRSDGTAAGTVVADGTRFRLAPQASFYYGSFGVFGEYTTSSQEVRRGTLRAELEHEAWQVSGVWVLTGENVSYRWYTPKRPFDRTAEDPAARGWGGLAVVARYNETNADPKSFPDFAAVTASEKAHAWAVGLDWTLQRQIRLLLDYEVTTFEGLGARRGDEKLLLTRAQIAF